MSYVDFLRPHAERSASPRDEPEPGKRNQPPTPEREPAHVERDPRAFTADAIETWRKAQQLEVDVQGVLSTRFFMNQTPHGEKAAYRSKPWWWRPVYAGADGVVHLNTQQPQPACPRRGAVFTDTEESRRLVRGISEAQAQRDYLREAVGEGGLRAMGLSPQRTAREKMGRRR